MDFQMEIEPQKFEIYVDGLDHPEGLAFDSDGVLWAGGEAGQVYRIDDKDRVSEVTNIGGFCLGLTFSSDDELFICNPKLSAVVRVSKSGKASLFVDSAGGRRLVNPNTSVFDSEGNLYVADSGRWLQDDGYIYRIAPDGNGEVFAGPLAFPNGTALSEDERFLYVALSTTDEVMRIEITRGGKAGDMDIYVKDIDRVPDGLALDETGSLYVSCYASDCIYRVDPQRTVQVLSYDRNGIILARPTNLAFGGINRDELYVANLGRWHIARTVIGRSGQRMVNQRRGDTT